MCHRSRAGTPLALPVGVMGNQARMRVAVLAVLALSGCDRARPSDPLTTIAAVRRLSPEEALSARPVRVRAVVTAYDSSAHRMVLHDGTGGISVDISEVAEPFGLGEAVDLRGLTGRGELLPMIVSPTLTAVPDGRLPEPRSVALAALASGEHDDGWVEARAVVRWAAVRHDGTLALDLGAGSVPLTARVVDSSGIVFASIVDATVAVRGVPTSILDARGNVVRTELLVAGRDQIRVEEPVPSDPYAIPAVSIATLVALPADDGNGHRVRVRAMLVAQDPGGDLRVQDATGTLRVRPSQRISLETGGEVDVLGFRARDAAGISLDRAGVRPVAANGLSEQVSAAAEPSKKRLLTTAAEVQGLTAAEASEGRPIHLRAVVTYYDPGWTILFVQDSSGGIFVDVNGLPPLAVRAGDLVEVTGLSDPGFAPQVVSPRIRLLGRGTLPAPRFASADQLFTGRLDAQWVEAEGIVQATRQGADRVWVEIAAGLHRFSLHTPGVWDAGRLGELVDARVRVRGACGTLFNANKQLVGIQIYAPGLDFLTVLEPGSADPFSSPLRPIASLLRFRRDAAGRRLRVEGIATWTGRDRLFLQDSTGGVLVQAAEAAHLQPGDRVEAVGFAAPGRYTPVLRDAVVRRIAAGLPPPSANVAAADAASGNHDGQLVRLDAYLLERVRTSHEHVLTLQAGRWVFDAHLHDRGDALEGLRPGSLLQLTGVLSVLVENSGSAPTPRSFEMLLRSPQDVVVLQAASRWTLRRILWAVVLLAGVVVMAVAWAVTLRRRVRSQTGVIERSHRELVSAERMASLGRLTAGIAHEMNTPLATVRAALFELQSLTAEYGAAVGDESVTPADHREIGAEMQRAVALADKAAERAAGFVRGIKSQTRDTGQDEGVRFDPAPIVQEALWLVGHAVRQANCTVEFETGRGPAELHGAPGRLAQVVTNLVTNAVDASREQGGGEVRLELRGNGTAVHLRVSDHGCGIPPESLPHIFEPMFTSKRFGEGTGLGLSIVHDIVTGHFGGEIKVDSEVGRGTTVEVVLPKANGKTAAGTAVRS